MFIIKYYGNVDELKVVSAFLTWQIIAHNIEEDFTVRKLTKGKNYPVVYKNNEIVAIGMVELLEYWEKEGMYLE